MTTKLKPCPCGERPGKLFIEPCTGEQHNSAYANVYGDCCGCWEAEFESDNATGNELTRLAEKAWNQAPRGGHERSN